MQCQLWSIFAGVVREGAGRSLRWGSLGHGAGEERWPGPDFWRGMWRGACELRLGERLGKTAPRLPKECGRHPTQVPVLSPARETPASADCPPSLRSLARFIPKGFPPIAGGERSVTTGQWPPKPPYPAGIAAPRALTPPSRLESIRDTGANGNVNRWCSLRSTTGYGLRPLRGGEWQESQGIQRRTATTLLRKSFLSEV